MRSRFLGAALVMLSMGLAASAQTPTTDQLQALKDTLSQDDQGSILQNILGNERGTGKKTDQKLKTPESVQQKDQSDIIQRTIKTKDGRILRQWREDPELRPGDSVMIELRPVEEICNQTPLGAALQNPDNNSNVTADAASSANSINALNGLNALNSAGSMSAISGLNGIESLNAVNGASGNPPPNIWIDLSRCPLSTTKPKTDDEKRAEARFRERILSNNPYKLNQYGVLELPSLPAMPLAGLTAAEATKRLSSDPQLRPFFARLTLLRLTQEGQEGLKPFGYDLFEGVPSTFAPVADIQVPSDYIVGPGDTLNIQLYGNEPARYELTVERDGRINFPKLGPILVSGMTFNAARETIEAHVNKQLVGSNVSVTMGDLRSIRVFVLGEAQKPGSYTVSGLSTMTNALFVSGGVKTIGSLRNIELKRNGQLITTLDLYALLLRGDTSGDRQLLPGDVIFIPPIGPTVSVYGAVRRPAIYELKRERTAEQAIFIAGGLSPEADAKRGELERILPSRLREMENIDLTAAAGRMTPLDNGDKLKIPEIKPILENSVTLTGYVYRPGSFAYHPGLRLSNVLNSFDELKPEADLHYIMIRRLMPPTEQVEVVSADLRRALGAPGSPADPELRPRDEIMVFNLAANRARVLEPVIRDLELQATPDKPEQVVSIDGEVKAPGRYPLEPKMHISDLIRAGGSLEDSAYRGQAELTRYAVVDGDKRQTDLITVNLGNLRRGDASADLVLMPYDTLVIKPIPMWMQPGVIEVAGEVRFPGKYPIHQGETLHSVLQRAGGFTQVAFPEGAVYIREELKEREKAQLEMLANRLQNDLAALSLKAVASSATVANGAGGAAASQGLLVGQQLLNQLRNAKPVGRLVINVQAVLAESTGSPDDVLVKDGDKLVIPKKTQEITILGEVQSPTSHVYVPGLTRDGYIARSGGTTQNADRKRIYVVRANGDVISGGRSGWFRRTQNIEMHPGDTIVVPLDTERVPGLLYWQAITTILYNLTVGILLVHEYL
ncbi:MAG: SLBB domain-containing protein [Steroidobacteraceae bacterium]